MKLTLVIPVYVSSDLHLDFTRQTLESIRTTHDSEVILVNNFCAPKYTQDLERLATRGSQLIDNPQGNILAAAWNLGIDKAFLKRRRYPSNLRPQPDPAEAAGSRGRKIVDTEPLKKPSDYCVILNNDLILHPQCLDHLVSFALKHPEFLLWSASEWANARTLAKAKMTQSFSPHPHFSCFMISPTTIKKIGYFDEHFTMGYFEDNDFHTRILQAGFQAAATDSAKFYHYGSRTINVDDNLKIEGKYHYQQNRAYFQKKWGVDIHGRGFSPPESILKELKPASSP